MHGLLSNLGVHTESVCFAAMLIIWLPTQYALRLLASTPFFSSWQPATQVLSVCLQLRCLCSAQLNCIWTLVFWLAVFMSVFKWEARKGWDVLLEAYLGTFKGDERVELHIMTKPFASKDQVRTAQHSTAREPHSLSFKVMPLAAHQACLTALS